MSLINPKVGDFFQLEPMDETLNIDVHSLGPGAHYSLNSWDWKSTYFEIINHHPAPGQFLGTIEVKIKDEHTKSLPEPLKTSLDFDSLVSNSQVKIHYQESGYDEPPTTFQCICDTKDMTNHGCQCGAFKAEMHEKARIKKEAEDKRLFS